MLHCHIIFIIFYILQYSSAQQLVCYTKFQLESEAIYNYFYSIHNGIYIDLQANHPIIDSNTLYLNTLGWRGINIVDTKEKQERFKKLRKLDGTINIQISKQAERGERKMSLAQICRSHLGIKPQFLGIKLQKLRSLWEEEYWKNQVCKPELILVQQYGPDKIQAALLQRMKENGYEKINSYESFVILIQEGFVAQYLERQKQNSRIYKNKELVPFSILLSQFSATTINQNATIYRNLNNSIFAEEIQIFFTRYGEVIDFTNTQNGLQIKSNNLVMQYNQHENILRFPQEIVSSELVTFSESQKFRHLIAGIEGKKINFYIFDHQFVNTLQVNEVVYEDFDKSSIKQLDQTQIPFLEKQQEEPSGEKQGDNHLLIIGEHYAQIEQLKSKNAELFQEMRKMSDSFKKEINKLQKQKEKLNEQKSVVELRILSKFSLSIIILVTIFLTATLTFFITKTQANISFRKIEQSKMQSEVQQNSNSMQDDNGVEMKNINKY